MLAKNNEIFNEVSQSLYYYNTDEQIKEQCRARQDYENHEKYVKNTIARLTSELEEKDSELQAKDNELQEKDNELQAKDSELQVKDSELQAQKELIVSLQKQLEEAKKKK